MASNPAVPVPVPVGGGGGMSMSEQHPSLSSQSHSHGGGHGVNGNAANAANAPIQVQWQHHLHVPVTPPSGDTLVLLAALSNPAGVTHAEHASALAARDRALAASPESYGRVCADLARTLGTSLLEGGQPGGPSSLPLPDMAVERLRSANPAAAAQLGHDPNGTWSHLRQMAGLLLKNALITPPPADPNPETRQYDGLGRPAGGYMVLPPDNASEIRSILLKCVADPNPAIRRVASSTVSGASVVPESQPGESSALPELPSPRKLAGPSLPLKQWPDLLPFLLGCAHSGLQLAHGAAAAAAAAAAAEIAQGKDGGAREAAAAAAASALDGSLLTLRKLLEDAPATVESDSGPSFADLVPLLLATFQSPDDRVKAQGLRCLDCLVPTMPGVLAVRIDDYLGGLSALASAADASPEVRQLVCRAIASMLSLRTEYLQPHFGPICEFILTATADAADEDVALEASEFWLTFASLEEDACSPDMVELVRQVLPRLVPVLLRGMVYTEEKREELMDANALDEANAADRVQDLAPVFHTSKAKRGGGDRDNGAGTNNNNDVDDGDESDDDMDDDDDNEWNVRKCSAASLDSLAGMYRPEDVLQPLLPALQEGLSHSDPWVREASVLALGAVADGCVDAMSGHMAQLHPYLMAQLTDPSSLPQLKSISAWTLGRYASWAVDQVHSGQPDILGKMTETLMGRVLDPNRKVQVAICSSFGVLVECAGELLVPYLEPIYRTFAQALAVYQTRSLMTLFDILGTMADYLGPLVGEGTLPSMFVPPLLQIWNRLATNNPMDRTLLPLLESLASIALVTGSNFQPWALETFEGALSTIETCNMVVSSLDDDYAEEEADPIVCSADLIDGLVEGLGANFPSLVSSSKRYSDHFLVVLHSLAAHEIAGVRMSAFALMGDLARHAPSVIQPGMNELMTEAIASMEPMYPSVCNNSVWAIGEVCSKCEGNPASLQPYAADIVQNLIALLMGNAVNADGFTMKIPGIQENAAATMGRLAKVSPSFVAGDLPRFLTGWCDGMAKISDPTERRDAFQGFILALHANPQTLHTATSSVPDAISAILFAVVSWHIPDNMSSPDGDYAFVPFPQENAEVGAAIGKLLHEVKSSVGLDTWAQVEKQMPVNVRRLLREAYNL